MTSRLATCQPRFQPQMDWLWKGRRHLRISAPCSPREGQWEFTELAGQSAWPAWFLENHDHSRVATLYAAAPGSGQRRARTAAMLICTLPSRSMLKRA